MDSESIEMRFFFAGIVHPNKRRKDYGILFGAFIGKCGACYWLDRVSMVWLKWQIKWDILKF